MSSSGCSGNWRRSGVGACKVAWAGDAKRYGGGCIGATRSVQETHHNAPSHGANAAAAAGATAVAAGKRCHSTGPQCSAAKESRLADLIVQQIRYVMQLMSLISSLWCRYFDSVVTYRRQNSTVQQTSVVIILRQC